MNNTKRNNNKRGIAILKIIFIHIFQLKKLKSPNKKIIEPNDPSINAGASLNFIPAMPGVVPSTLAKIKTNKPTTIRITLKNFLSINLNESADINTF